MEQVKRSRVSTNLWEDTFEINVAIATLSH